MKLGLKIILPILLLLVIVTGAFGYILHSLRQQETVISKESSKIRTLNGLNERLARQQDQTEFSVLAYRFNQDKASLLAISQSELDKSKTLDEMYPFITTPRGRELINSYITSRKEIESLRSEVLKAIDGGDQEQIALHYNKWNIQTQNIKAALADIGAYNINSLEKTLATVGDIRNKISEIIIILVFVVVAIVLFLYFYLRVVITTPIIKLAQFADEVAHKNFTTTTTTTTRNDELGVLSRAFNTMVVKLKESYTTLEQKVVERTRKLSEKTQEAKDSEGAIMNILEDLKITEEQTKEKTAALAEAQAIAHIGNWEWDIVSNNVIWSDELYRLFDLAPQSMTLAYDSYLKLVYPDDQENAGKVVGQAMKTHKPFEFDHRAKLADGTIRWIRGRGQVMKGKDGAPTKMVGTAQDITEQKQFEQMKDDFMNIAAHDLRTPSTAVKGFVSMIRKGDFGPPPTGEIGEALKDVEDATDRMITMVNDFLTVSRIEQGRLKITPQPLDISQFLHDLVRQLEVTILNPKVKLQLSEIADLPKAFADREKIAQVVTNIIDNALKHTETGTVTVSARKAEKNMIEIMVADTGTGISPEDLPKLFGRYYRGKQTDAVATSRGGGLGLGLYVVKTIIELHGGTVWAESVFGKSTKIHLTLPIVVESGK